MHLYGQINRQHLTALATATGAIGPRGEPGISELFGRIADAAEYDLAQTAALLAPLVERPAPAATPAKSYLMLHLGVPEEAERRKAALARLVEALAASGYRRTRPSVSRLAELLSAHAAADLDQTASTLAEVMNLAAQSYVLAAEDMADQAAEAEDGQRLKLGKYTTEREAKVASDRATSPFVVRFADGLYEWYAHNGLVGYVPADGRSMPYERALYRIVSRYVIGRGWKATNR